MVQIHPDPPLIGGVAQLGERMLCKHEVIGSIPFTSTNDFAARNHNVKGIKERQVLTLVIERVHVAGSTESIGKPLVFL